VQYFNHRHGRSGTLWQGRFKSCLVQDDFHRLQTIRYIELNPVRAALTTSGEAHRWSSVYAHLGGDDSLLTQHPLALGPTADVRAVRHRAWLQEAIDDEEIATIRRYVAQEWALGNPRFQAMVSNTLGQHAEGRAVGRPRLSQTGTEGIKRSNYLRPGFGST
jgi:putative transposase